MTVPHRVGVLHLHSDYSHDGRDSIESLRDFATERGISFLGMTEHAEDFDAERFARYVRHCRAASDAAVTIIPGLEFRFPGHSGLHLLALGVGQWIAPGTPAEFFELARTAARLTVLAHPVLAKYRVPELVMDGVDAIEVWNANYNTRYLPDPRAIRLLHSARRRGRDLVGIAGLDQHDRRNDRRVRVLLTGSGPDPLVEIRGGRFINVGLTMSFDPAVSWSPAKLLALSAVRAVYDRIERAQERLSLLLR